MLRIGIADDEKEAIEELSGYVKEFMDKKGIDVIIDKYEDGTKLEGRSVLYDLVFLDISMPEMSGIELAQKIRLTNRKLKIVYVTNYKNYHRAAFTVHAYGYLEKPISLEKVSEILTDFFQEKRDEKHLAILKLTDGTNYFADISYICCFEYDGNRKVKVHMYNKKCINISTTLKALEKEYGKYGFVSPYQSYLINLARVEHFDIRNKLLVFDNGTNVEVAEKKTREIQAILAEYFHKRLEDK
ncbi:MAG: response regulator transcription factor [Ruminococcus sp.]|nr:response regulator transcription factor [Ruminococcus sp.]